MSSKALGTRQGTSPRGDILRQSATPPHFSPIIAASRRLSGRFLGIGFFVLAALSGAIADAGGPRISSSPGIAPGVAAHDGFTIVPVLDVPTEVYTEDLAQVQVFEIIRPDQRPFSIGRILASCTCLDVSMDKNVFGEGERALIEARNVKPTQPEGATYAFFIELELPFRQILQYDVFVKSDRRPPPPGSGSVVGRP